jgi:Phosphofructokinase
MFYAQSGGVSAVINASACGVLQAASQHSQEIGKVYAGRNGIIGALTEDLIDTSVESEVAIAALKHTPGAAFGSCRYKLTSIHEHREQYERLIEVFRAHDIGFFFYNGGGDSQDTAYKVSQIAPLPGRDEIVDDALGFAENLEVRVSVTSTANMRSLAGLTRRRVRTFTSGQTPSKRKNSPSTSPRRRSRASNF